MAITADISKSDMANGYVIEANGTYRIKGVGAKYGSDFNFLYANDGITDGQWDGATLQVQFTPDGSEALALDMASGSLTADGYLKIEARTRALLLVVSGGTAPKIRIDLL